MRSPRVLIAQDERRIEVHSRTGIDTPWESRHYHAGEVVQLPSLGVSLPTNELYEAAGVRAD